MTIKDLCNNTPVCDICSFRVVCPNYGASTRAYSYPGNLNNEDNNAVTKAIIETSRQLLEDLE